MDIRLGAFLWKIDNLDPEESYNAKSSDFKFRRDNCCIKYEMDDDNSRCLFGLYGNENFDYKTVCKMCILDSRGEELLVTKRTKLARSDELIPFMIIDYTDLMDNLLTDGDLIVSLTWWDQGCIVRERGTQTPTDHSSEKEITKFLQTLSKDFRRSYESKADTDCVLKVGDDQIPVHRFVLSARSEVFAAMFRHDTSENRIGVVDIPDVDVAVLNDVLHYVYSGQMDRLSGDTASSMYVVADKYALIELRDACLNVLKHGLTVENVCDAALLAHVHGEAELEEQVVQFVNVKFEEIEETDKWKELLKSKPLLPFKLLRSAFMIDKDKNLFSKRLVT